MVVVMMVVAVMVIMWVVAAVRAPYLGWRAFHASLYPLYPSIDGFAGERRGKEGGAQAKNGVCKRQTALPTGARY